MNSFMQRLMSGLPLKLPLERPTMKQLSFNIENTVRQTSFSIFRLKNKVKRLLKKKSVRDINNVEVVKKGCLTKVMVT